MFTGGQGGHNLILPKLHIYIYVFIFPEKQIYVRSSQQIKYIDGMIDLKVHKKDALFPELFC